MSQKQSEYIVLDNLINDQIKLINEYKNKDEYDYQSVILLSQFYIVVNNIRTKNHIIEQYINFYKRNYVYVNVDFILSILTKILNYNIVIDDISLIINKWQVMNNKFIRQEYHMSKCNEDRYELKLINEYIYASYKDIK